MDELGTKAWWGGKEGSTLFRGVTEVPFDELDYLGDRKFERYPVTSEVKEGGELEIGQVAAITMCERAARVVNEIAGDEKLRKKLMELKWVKSPTGKLEPAFDKVGLDLEGGKVEVVFDPVWTNEEVGGAVARVREKLEELGDGEVEEEGGDEEEMVEETVTKVEDEVDKDRGRRDSTLGGGCISS